MNFIKNYFKNVYVIFVSEILYITHVFIIWILNVNYKIKIRIHQRKSEEISINEEDANVKYLTVHFFFIFFSFTI